MKIGIMQPYFFPYIGYFQLMNAVDEFVVYDNIEYTKKGWINRNRILVNGQDSYVTLSIRKDSDYLDVKDRYLAEIWPLERKKMLSRISESYRKAPHFKVVYPIVEEALMVEEINLFKFLLNSLTLIKKNLEIKTPLIVSSTISIAHELKAKKKVIALCKARNANEYLNPIGGVELYSKEDFKVEGIALNFIKSGEIKYQQYGNDFVPWLSIIDVMMFNSKEEIEKMLGLFTLE